MYPMIIVLKFVARYRYLSIILFAAILIGSVIFLSYPYLVGQQMSSSVFWCQWPNYTRTLQKWYNYTGDCLNGPNISMDDPRLIDKIEKFLIKPIDFKLKSIPADNSYRLLKPNVKDQSVGQTEKILNILQNRTNGFFIEAGALDGEALSNTLYLERYLNWTGLLIEAAPINFLRLAAKNRRAWISPTCLSIHPYPEIVLFEQNQGIGAIVNSSSENDNNSIIINHNRVNVQCFPLYTYLLALNVTHIDYFSLDVEGSELDVLKTIPFKDLNIETLSVEFAHVPEGKDAVTEFMFNQGYVIESEVPTTCPYDLIFIKENMNVVIYE